MSDKKNLLSTNTILKEFNWLLCDRRVAKKIEHVFHINTHMHHFTIIGIRDEILLIIECPVDDLRLSLQEFSDKYMLGKAIEYVKQHNMTIIYDCPGSAL